MAPGVCAAGLHGVAGFDGFSAHLIAPPTLAPVLANAVPCRLPWFPSLLKYGVYPAQTMPNCVIQHLLTALFFLHQACSLQLARACFMSAS